MIDSTSPLAIWNAKTETEQIDWIAEEIMKWKRNGHLWHQELPWEAAFLAHPSHTEDEEGWNPIRDWNYFMAVEEKIMGDLELSHEYILVLMKGERQIIGNVRIYMKTTLSERCTALYLAYTSLHPTL